MALPQDGQDANGLTKVTQIPAGKELMFIDPTTNEGGIITLEDLTKQILNGLTSQTFGLDSGTQTLPAAINYLYGKSLHFGFPSKPDSFYSSEKGIYFLSTSDYEKLPDKPYGFSGRSIWIYSHYNSNERVGILTCSGNGKFAIGYCFGGNSLSWNIIK